MHPNLQYSSLHTSLNDFQEAPSSNDETIDVFPPSSNQPSPNPRFPIYQRDDIIFLETLGKGGNSVVYKAYNKKANRLVALKKIPLNDGISPILSNNQRIFAETSIFQTLSSKKISHFLDYFGVYQDNFDVYIEMQPGLVTLNEILESGRVFSRKEILFILREIVNALVSLENNGIVNRDIKPHNIMLVPTFESPYHFEYKLYDFGIGYQYPPNEFSHKIHKRTLLGYTPEYTAPELLSLLRSTDITNENYDPYSADIYSLGITALKMLGNGSKENFNMNFNDFLDDNKELGEIVAFMMVSDPDQRIKLSQLKERLDEIVEKKSILPPIIEKSAIKKALTFRAYKLRPDYSLVVSDYLDAMGKYFDIGKMVDFERTLELSLYELIKEGSNVRFTNQEVELLIMTGNFFQRNSNFLMAEKAFNKAYEIAKKLMWDQNDGFLPGAAFYLGCCYLRWNKLDKAEVFLTEAFKINRQFYGEQHLSTSNTLRQLGELYLKKQDYAKALEMLSLAMKNISRLLYAEDKPSNHQVLMECMNMLSAEEVSHMRVLNAFEQSNIPMISLEILDQRAGSLNDQEEYFRTIQITKQKAWKKVHSIINKDLALVLGALGRLNLFLGDVKKTKTLLGKGLSIMSGIYGECNWEVARFYESLSKLYEEEQELEKAQKVGLRCLEIRIKTGGNSLETIESLIDLERVNARMGEENKSKEFKRRKDEIIKKVSDENQMKEKEIQEMLGNFSVI